MSTVGLLLGWVLTLFILVMIVRAVLDWVGLVTSTGALRARRISHALTEPVIAPVRRVLRPARMGSVSLDLAFSAVLIAAVVLRAILFSL